MRLPHLLPTLALLAAVPLCAEPPEPDANPPASADADDAAADMVAMGDGTITVAGDRMPKAVIAQRSREFLRSVLPLPSYGQYARWARPVCVKFTDLADEFQPVFRARMAAAANIARLKLQFENCRPNLLIAFSHNGADTAATIIRRRPGATAQISTGDRTLLTTSAMPVRWWHMLEPANSSGVSGSGSAAINSAQFGENRGQAGLPGNVDTFVTDGYSSSLIDTHLIVGVAGAVVVVDVPLSTGKSLDALADYVAMVSLAPTRLSAPPPQVPSVLASFARPGLGTTATDWDRAWLKGLYAMPMNRKGVMQRGSIAVAMTKALVGQP